ncbi:serine O-acetyltransferase EpsC [uncultured Amnibacterium sp.]|uniref:serine O-acetyltransferase EpsC n=1 Tax=uncultured Amnibacterium sp. TaxID=1631851 RepID=UPI0035CC6E71
MSALGTLREDVHAARQRDPAAKSGVEVVLTYPGLHAVWAYRLHHRLWVSGSRLPARILSQLVRFLTGIEIHPGATIGRRLFIDHGSGVVIGETAEVGDDVTMFHGVTLGGTVWRDVKRHPTVGDRVLIGAGAKLLGAITIGADSVIGAGAVVLHDAPPHSLLVGVPAVVRPRSPLDATEHHWVI